MSKKNKKPRNKIGYLKTRAVKVKTESSFMGFIKTSIFVFMMLSQLLMLVFAYLDLMKLFVGYVFFSFIISFLCVIYVLTSEKNAYSKTVWTMFLLLFFVFAWYIYLLSEEKLIFRRFRRKYNKIINNSRNLIKIDDVAFESERVVQDCNYLKVTGDFPSFTNCKTKYFPSGLLLFDDIIENLQIARDYIFIEFFIIADGVLLKRVINILEDKVKQGVDVRIIYDDLGSHGKLSAKTKKLIKKKGIKFMPYNRLVPIISMTMNFRNHRKIVIIDGNIAYTGGANLADEYVNEKRMHGYWKDAGIKIEGRAVDSFTLSFLRQWEFLTNKPENYNNFFNKSIKYENYKSVVVPFVDGLEYLNSIGHDMYLNLISKADKKIYIMTPYFVPDEGILMALKNKALSGVDVKIILPQIADKGYVYKVSLANAKNLLKYGVKVYLMKDSFVHSKVMLTDYAAIIGSINVDMRAFYQQFESAVYTNDAQVLNEINEDFITTLEECEEKTLDNFSKDYLFKKLTISLLRVLSPLM